MEAIEMQEGDEIEISQDGVRRFVSFLLNDPTICPRQSVGEIAREARNAKIGTVNEFYEALGKVVHLAREMLALEKIDASIRAADKVLTPRPEPTPRRRKRKASVQADLFN